MSSIIWNRYPTLFWVCLWWALPTANNVCNSCSQSTISTSRMHFLAIPNNRNLKNPKDSWQCLEIIYWNTWRGLGDTWNSFMSKSIEVLDGKSGTTEINLFGTLFQVSMEDGGQLCFSAKHSFLHSPRALRAPTMPKRKRTETLISAITLVLVFILTLIPEPQYIRQKVRGRGGRTDTRHHRRGGRTDTRHHLRTGQNPHRRCVGTNHICRTTPEKAKVCLT